jgi:hypothetical protein
MQAGLVQDLGSIEIADARKGLLIEQGHFDGPLRPAEASDKQFRRNGKGVRANAVRTEIPLDLRHAQEANAAQAPAVPKPQIADRALRQADADSQVLNCRRIGDKYQARHPRLEDDRVARRQLHENPFARAIDRFDALTKGTTAEHVDSRLESDRFARASQPLDAHNDSAADREGAAAHRFNFGELGHEGKVGSAPGGRVG